MLEKSEAFSGFAVRDLDAAKDFYEETLGLSVRVLDEENGLMQLELAGGRNVLVYRKDDHAPATYTILNFQVDDVEGTVAGLRDRGVEFERYEGTDVEADEDGVFRGPGPLIAWFTDPSGNILSVVEDG